MQMQITKNVNFVLREPFADGWLVFRCNIHTRSVVLSIISQHYSFEVKCNEQEVLSFYSLASDEYTVENW